MMTTDEMIAILQAHREGKKIQFLYAGSQWQDNPFGFDFINARYRVAPEPREWEISVRPDGLQIATGLKVKEGERVLAREVI